MIGETTFQATARYENGASSIKVTASTPYGSRSASFSVDVTDEKLLGKLDSLFEAAIKSVREEAQQQSVKAAAQAFVVATENKEAL
jgi:hypothetical protein